MRTYLFTSLFFFCFFMPKIEGQIQLNIQITDKDNGEPLPLANILFQRNQIGVSTDLEGKAQVDFPKEALKTDSLFCSYIGYRDTFLVVKLNQNQSLQIALQSEVEQLSAIEVTGRPLDLTALEIVKEAIKNIKKNYPIKPTYLHAFYRETSYENKQTLNLNEAAVKFHYTGYPQKRFVKKAWKHYWKEDFKINFQKAKGRHIFMNPQFFKYYNTINDQCKIIASRSSDNWSNYGIETAPWNGPLGLTSADKVKYLADFLDPKLLKSYTYEKQGAAYVNGTPCFIIHFKPFNLSKLVWQQWNNKIKFPLFAGKLFIDTETFAVVKIECQFSPDAKTDIYKKSINLSDIIALEIDYKKSENRWFLDHVKTYQVKHDDEGNLLNSDYSLIRELWINKIDQTEVLAFDDTSLDLLKDMTTANLRDFTSSYNPDFWATYEQSNDFVPWPKKDKEDLEKEQSLHHQFENRFIKKDLPPPVLALQYDTISTTHGMLIDPFSYLEKPSEITKAYIQKEKDYFNNFLIPHKRSQQNAYYNVINRVKNCDTLNKQQPSSFRMDYSDEGEKGIVQFLPNGQRKLVLALADILPKENRLTYFKLNKKENRLAIQFKDVNEKLQVHIYDLVQNKKIAEFQQAIEFQWINEEALIFIKENEQRRWFEINLFSCLSNKKIKLLEASDEEHEVEYTFADKTNQSIILTQRSSSTTENGFILVDDPSYLVRQLTKSDDFYTHQIRKGNTHWYLLGIKDNNQTQLFSRPIDAKESDPWILEYTPKSSEWLDDFLPYKNHFLIKVIDEASVKLAVVDRKSKRRKWLDFPEEFYSIQFDVKHDFNQSFATFIYSSLNFKDRKYQYHFEKESLTYQQLICQPEVKYPRIESKLKWVIAKDGEKIPLLISNMKFQDKEHKGLLLMAYGAYGAFNESSYDEFKTFLLNEGYTVAQAYVRGSRAKGWSWYEQGKRLNKTNSISDYLACARFLIEKEYTDKEHLVAYGQSAGGLVIGAAINESPELFKAAILDYPFLDLMTVSLNDSLPLTTLEYQEWGNPKDKTEYDYMNAYAPYEHIQKQAYPHLLLAGGKKDYQTPLWQILKATAKYRSFNTADTETLLFVGEEGHPGKIPYSQRMKEMIYFYVFIQEKLGLNKLGNR